MASKIRTLIAEPPEGSPADWYARGYRDGTIYGAEQSVREVVALEPHVRDLLSKVSLLINEMQRLYGEAASQSDRWQLHPAYLRAAEEFDRRQSADKPTMRHQMAGEVPDEPVEKPKRARRLKAEVESGPTLNLDMPKLLAESDVGPTDEEQMLRAAGHAWRV